MTSTNIDSNSVHHQQKMMIDGLNNNNRINYQIKYPKRQTLRQSLSHNLHLRCLCLTMFIYLAVVGLFWCQIENFKYALIKFKLIEKPFSFHQSYYSTPSSSSSSSSSSVKNVDPVNVCRESFIRTLPLICLVILYLAYLIECWHCSTRFILLHGKDVQHVYRYMDQMKQAKPIIWWKAASYHYVHYNHSVTRHIDPGFGVDGSGTITTSRHYNKRIDTHHSKACFSYKNFELRDISEKLVGVEMFPITRINIQKCILCFVFTDPTSAQEFDRQRSSFFRSNFKLDQYLEIREGVHLNGIDCKDCLITLNNNNFRYWYYSLWAFWLFSLILLSWPLRILLECNTAFVNYKIVKLFGLPKKDESNGSTNENNPNDHLMRCFLPRPITIDSLNNCTMAPSYSEAILIDQAKPDTINNLPSYDDVIKSNCQSVNQIDSLRPNLFDTTINMKLSHLSDLKRSLTYNSESSSLQRNLLHNTKYKSLDSLQNITISNL